MKLAELKDEIGYAGMRSIVQTSVDLRMNFYDSKYAQTKELLKKVKEVYQFETIHNIYNSPNLEKDEIHLEFVTGISLDFSTIVCLNMHGSVAHDKLFGELVPMMKIDDIPEEEFTEGEIGEYIILAERLFYTWLAYLWQDINGIETGLKVSIVQGASTQEFSLIDYKWDEDSKYFDFKNPPKRIDKSEQKRLSLVELYRCTEKA